MRLLLFFATLFVLAAIAYLGQSIIKESFEKCKIYEVKQLADNVVIQIVDDACQEGLPHTTTSDIIRMPISKWNGPMRDKTIKHELVHISQKRNPRAWANFYAQAWKYQILDRPPAGLPQSWIHKLRPNPDTADAPWSLWRGKYLIFPAFTADNTLKGAEVHVWNTEKGAFDSLPEEWKRMFCASNNCPYQFEHPHELAAELYTSDSNTPAANMLKKFMKQIIQ